MPKTVTVTIGIHRFAASAGSGESWCMVCGWHAEHDVHVGDDDTEHAHARGCDALKIIPGKCSCSAPPDPFEGAAMIGTILSLHARCPGHAGFAEAFECSDSRLRAALEMLKAPDTLRVEPDALRVELAMMRDLLSRKQDEIARLRTEADARHDPWAVLRAVKEAHPDPIAWGAECADAHTRPRCG